MREREGGRGREREGGGERQRQIRVMEVKKITYGETFEGSNILLLESRAYSMSLQICISFFTIYSGSNT